MNQRSFTQLNRAPKLQLALSLARLSLVGIIGMCDPGWLRSNYPHFKRVVLYRLSYEVSPAALSYPPLLLALSAVTLSL